ncbi:MAG: hypothetical protein JSW66_14660 [Phycisphaerales bacterium]|nr:MAG: hypothetical protein JSW66_14660 [Phycisphaerales bacterium]
MKKLTMICVLAALVVPGSGVRAAVTNGSFETGDLTGWSWTIPAGASIDVVTSHSDPTGTGTTSWGPTDGSYFALLKTDGPGSLTQLYQSYSMTPGNPLMFDYFWDSRDYKPFDDTATLSVYSGVGVGGPLVGSITLNSVSADPQDYWGTPWQTWSLDVGSAGLYTVAFEVRNSLDGILDSFIGIDNVRLDIIPAPEAVLLAGIGVGLIGWLRRRSIL